MAKTDFKVTQDYLWARYTYNAETGEFMSRRTNNPVGYAHRGYLALDIKNKRYKLHRLIWLYVYGKWPEPMADHLNGNRKDNRLFNLREVTAKQNAENRNKINANSGLKGVHGLPSGKWVASIGHQRKVIYLGTFDTKEDAHSSYCKAASFFHTHNSFGKNLQQKSIEVA